MKYINLIFLFCASYFHLSAQNDKQIFEKFTSAFIEVNGYKINVETLGTGDPLFFFAGGPGDSHDYLQGSFGHYYTTHQVVFIDMLGRGKSDDAKNNAEYTIENDINLVEEIRNALGLNKISMVGHSYGTMVAQGYAIKYPENVDRMILINGFHSGEMWQANCDSYNHYAKTHFPEIWKKVDSLRVLGYVSSDPVFSAVYGSAPSKYVYYHDTQVDQNRPEGSYRGFNLDVYYSIVGRDADFFVGGSMIDTDYRRQLGSLDIPTLIIAGRYDGISTPEYSVQYKTYMPEARFVMFEQSGHNPYREEQEKFFALMDDFLGVARK